MLVTYNRLMSIIAWTRNISYTLGNSARVAVIKMATPSVHALVVVSVTLLLSLNATSGIRVTISSPTNSITNGGILAIQCQVWDIDSNFEVNIFRATKAGFVKITNEEGIARSSERLHMFLAKRTFPDGSKIYFVTIIGTSNDDEGEYFCKVLDLSTATFIGEDSVDIKIYSYPAKMYPLCSSTPNQPTTMSVHDTLTLACTSEKGVPTIQMKWMNNKSARYIADRNRTDGNLVHSKAVLQIDDSLQGVVFSCEISSKAFSDWKRTCYIGPITVRTNYFGERNHGVTLNEPDVSGIEQNNIQNLHLNEKCGICASDDEMLQFYLTIATIGTGLLTILFLTTTIILCYKYHHISNESRRDPTRVLTPQQSIEPVYVSLQRRSVNADREYMTLEDPNNPENKILLPKETFDEYCRTMTLKRV